MAISLLPSISTSALLRLEIMNWVNTMESLYICENMCIHIHTCCCCSVAKLHLTLCDSMNWSRPGFLVFNYLLEFAQTHVHWVDNAIQPSHPPSPTFPPALNLSQHQRFFQCIGSSHQGAKVVELPLQHQYFQWIFRVDFLWIDWFDLHYTHIHRCLLREREI